MLKTKMQVKLLDLNRQYQGLEEAVFDAFKEVFKSKQFIMGPKVQELETSIASYTSCKHAIGVSSGTDALSVALMALGIQAGDEVITTPFTFFATAGCISRLGAIPVFVDIDSETYNIDPTQIESKITSKTKAIIPVHLFGQMADMDAIMSIAEKHGLYVIEDAAQAIGSKASFRGEIRAAGSIGDLGCFSFFPSKNLGCCGDGGIVTTNNDALEEKCRILRMHGSAPKYHHHVVGGNFRLDPLQAAILSVKLPFLNEQHEKRRLNAERYNQKLSDQLTIPTVKKDYYMIYNQYTLRSKNRKKCLETLNEYQVGNMIYYPVPLHLQACFSSLGYKEGDCPVAEQAAKEVFSIPVYPELTTDEQDYVIDVLNMSVPT